MNTVFRRIVWLIMLVPAIYLAIIWKQIPQTVPMHFDLKGNIDKYGSKDDLRTLVIVLTIVNAITYLFISNIYKIDPKKNAAQNKSRMQRMAVGVSIYLTAIVIMLVYEISTNNVSITVKFVSVAMGLLFALIGNNMYNIKPNYFAGIRLPWTLESEENWRRTHQLGGRLWFFGGLFFALIAMLVNKIVLAFVGIALLLVLIIIPIIYSYRLYKKTKGFKAAK